jgi:hypothetical protein
VVVICPHRGLHFGALTPVQEFVERRVLWVELQPRDGQPPITPLARVLSLLLEPESQVRRISDALHQQAFTDPVAAEVLQLIPSPVALRIAWQWRGCSAGGRGPFAGGPGAAAG